MYSFIKKLALLLTLSIIISCNRNKAPEPEPEVPTPEYGSLSLEIDHKYGESTFELNQDYTTTSGQTIRFTDLSYYLSNVKLMDWDEVNVFEVPNSYYYVEAKNGKKTIVIPNIPIGDYDKIEFSIGVDSLANHDIDRNEGDLDPAGNNRMIWNWNTGYKFLRAEGAFDVADSTDTFIFHTGGNQNYVTIKFDGHEHEGHKVSGNQHFGISIESGKTAKLAFTADAKKLFENPNTVNFGRGEGQIRSAHGASGGIIVNNYRSGFILPKHDH